MCEPIIRDFLEELQREVVTAGGLPGSTGMQLAGAKALSLKKMAGSRMSTSSKTLIDLETRFWQSMVSQDTDAALGLLNEPALMVSAHGAMKFDHAGYRKMAEHGSMVLKSFDLSDMEAIFPNDTTAILMYRVKQRVASRDKDESTTQEMNDTSTWIKTGKGWQCVMHTETPAEQRQ